MQDVCNIHSPASSDMKEEKIFSMNQNEVTQHSGSINSIEFVDSSVMVLH